MKIIKKKERGYRSFIEKYDLNGSYAGQRGIPIGVLLLYILVENAEVSFMELTAEAEGEIGEAHNILNETDKNFLANLNNLAGVFKRQELMIWELKGKYANIEICITGRTYGTVLSIRTPLKSKVNMLPLMNAVELATYNYHNYNPQLVIEMKQRFKLNQKVTIQMLLDLEKYPDIYEEFLSGIKKKKFEFPSNRAITVEGYTAEYLYTNFPLSELGAYNYLIYLRETPQEALDDLKKGLPRK